MPGVSPPVLTQEQIEQFITRSYVVIKQAIPRETALGVVDRTFERLGYDRQDPSTWELARMNMPPSGMLDVEAREIAPRAWAAACELAGGADRLGSWRISDGVVLSLGPHGKEPRWQPASGDAPGWHKDGGDFIHFLDSPEMGLLAVVCWSDIEHRGGPTYVACDSVPIVSDHLAQHPEGLEPKMPGPRWARQCEDFVELTAQAGDIVLLHPFTLHAASQNVRRLPRVISNAPIRLREPMNFNRADPADFSPVERAVLRGLGKQRYDFQITGQRRAIRWDGQEKQEQFLKAERARREAAGP